LETKFLSQEFCKQGNDIKSWVQFDMTNFCMHNCGLGKLLPPHAAKWGQHCCRWRASVAHTYAGRCQWYYTL